MIKVIGHTEAEKWFGCILCAYAGPASDLEHHLQHGAKAFQKHRWMLQYKGCSVKPRLRYFDAIASSTACFAAEHRPWSGQVRPARQWRARFRAQAQNARICTQLLFTCGKNRQTNLNVSSTPFHPKQLLSRTQYSCICNTLEALIPTYVVDGPHVEHLKDARTANVEPTDAQAKWQHALPNSNSFCM